MKSKFELSKEGRGIPDLIVDDADYLNVVDNFDTLKELVEFYKENEEFNTAVNINIESLAIYYFFCKNSISNEDKNYLNKIGIKKSIADINKEIENLNNRAKLFNNLSEEYDLFTSDFEENNGVSYKIVEMSKTNSFLMKDPEDDRLLDISDVVNIYDKLQPSFFSQMIIYCNSIGKIMYKVSTKFPIKYVYDMINEQFKNNTITFFYGVSGKEDLTFKKAVLNFETSSSEVEIFLSRKNDNTQFNIDKQCEGIIKFEKNPNNNVVSGYIEFSNDKNIPILPLYETVLLDERWRYFISINEANVPFFNNINNFSAEIYHPLTYVMIYFLGAKNYPKTSITFKEQKIGKDKYQVDFKSTDKEVTNSVAELLSKLIGDIIENNVISYDYNYRSKFFSTTLAELKAKTGILLKTLDLVVSQSYSTACKTERQPILISEEEAEEYVKYGRNIERIENNGETYIFVCMNELTPIISMVKSKVEYKSGITEYPCCFSNEITKKDKDERKTSESIGNREEIKNYGNAAYFTGDASDFIKTSFIDSGNVSPVLLGTCFYKDGNSRSINDSCIGALIQATGSYNIYNDSKREISKSKFDEACQDVRRRLIELPFDIYRQELYDINRDEFILNMLNPDHYIDPYLYYRGLEEIFDVNIFVFTSPRLKSNPVSLEEFYSSEQTLEIPKCHEYHTRRKNNRDIVCIYKNFGMSRTISKKLENFCSCELIGVTDIFSDKGTIISKFDFLNKKFNDAMWSFFYKSCKPILFVMTDTDVDAYEDPYSKFSPEQIGEFIDSEPVGQKINIYGKTTVIIYRQILEEDNEDEPIYFNIKIPGIQPINFYNEIPPKFLDTEISEVDKYNGETELGDLLPKKQILEIFDVTDHDDEGCYVPFLGMPRGLKIFCEDDNELKHENYFNINKSIMEENNVSCLLQLINWLWRSETLNGSLPRFEDWFDLETMIELVDEEEFENLEPPETFMNNAFLPKLEDFSDRMKVCNYYWPFIFTEDEKIKLYDKLYIRIRNLMNIQDFQTRSLSIETKYNEIPTFISNLIPTDYDYERSNSLIFTSKETLLEWVSYTNRKYFGAVSLNNMNIVNKKIYSELYSTIQPYVFKDQNGKIYIIQNVSDGSSFVKNGKKIAIEIAYKWKLTRKNIGSTILTTFSAPLSTEYVLYEIKQDSNVFEKLVEVDTNRTSSDNYLQILQYPKGNFAAMLELL